MFIEASNESYFLRASFILSPGVNSEAPFDIPVVPVVRESFILSPGDDSEAPRMFELFIRVPGAVSEAPLVPDEPAKLNPDDPISNAAVAIIKVFFMYSPNIGLVVGHNVGRIEWFVLH